MPFVKGKSGNAEGRKKGSLNKTTVAAKSAFQMAFDKLGGWERMAKWAEEDPDNMKTFYTLYARLIPVDVTSKDEKLDSAHIHITREVITKKP